MKGCAGDKGLPLIGCRTPVRPLAQGTQEVHRRGVGDAIDGERNGCAAGLGRDPLGEIRSVEKHDVAADRLEVGHDILTPHHVDGLQAKRFCDRDQRPPDAGIGAVLNDPGARRQVTYSVSNR